MGIITNHDAAYSRWANKKEWAHEPHLEECECELCLNHERHLDHGRYNPKCYECQEMMLLEKPAVIDKRKAA